MAQSLMLQPKGLYSYYNHLSQPQDVPSGALLVATNAVIDRNSVLNSRRGYKIYGNAMDSTITDTAHQLLNYKRRLLRHWGIGPGHFLDWDDGTGNFTTFSFDLVGTTHTTTTIDGITTTSNLEIGMFVTGTGIPANTTISSIPDNTSIIISNSATSSNVGITLSFTYDIQELSQGTRIKGIESNGNFYFTTSNGIKKISVNSATGFPTAFVPNAGVPAALDLSTSLGTSAVGFLNGNSSCAYRIIWGITDANNNTLFSAPGSRTIVNNPTSSPENVNLTITIPQGITTSHFYQVYRTPQISLLNTFTIVGDTTNGSTTITNIADTSGLVVGMGISGTSIQAGTTITSISSLNTVEISLAATPAATTGINLTVSQQLTGTFADPGDEEQLAYEANPTNTDLTNGFITVTDIADDSFLGAYLYTNQNSGEGILQSNYPPPLALDLTSFKNYTFYANTSDIQQINLALLAVSNLTSGVSYLKVHQGSTVNTYTFKTQTINCTTHSNTTIDGIASTATLIAGQSISGANIVSGTYIVSIDSGTSITISEAATSSSGSDSFVAGYESSSLNYVGISQFPTPGQQVGETTASLVRIINRNDADVVYVYTPNDAPTDVPGQMLFKARNLSTGAFYFTVDDAATTGTQFNPSLTTAQQTDATSTNNVFPNRVWYSKLQQPDAVPIVNFFDVGPKDKAISRVLALRDNLFIVKEEAVYRLTGTDPASFTVFPFDFSTQIASSDSAVVLNNLIYMFSNQGIATISDTGVAIISRPIEGQLLPLLTSQYVNFSTATFGVTYETDRSYYLFTVTDPADTFPTQCFRYNTFTQTWTILDISKRCGLVNVNDNLLYLGATDINFLEQERKHYDRTDYADREYAITLATGAVNDEIITLPSLTNVSANDVVLQTQYLSLKEFNRILTKLDNDNYLSPHDYTTTLTADPGVNLSNKLDLLLAKIAADPGRNSVSGHTAGASYTALIGTGFGSFTALQTCFNNMVTLLNNDVGAAYSDYMMSTGTVDYEFYIVSTIPSGNQIVAPYSYPLIAGPITVFQYIPVLIQFIPQTLGDVSMTKHIYEGTYIFEDASFTNATVSYSTDLSANFESVTINGLGNGIFGNTTFGEGVFGGSGSGVPFRTYLPRNKARARYINCQFEHSIAREIFYLYGLSLTFNPVSSRGYR
jgi:hypothetical protein